MDIYFNEIYAMLAYTVRTHMIAPSGGTTNVYTVCCTCREINTSQPKLIPEMSRAPNGTRQIVWLVFWAKEYARQV